LNKNVSLQEKISYTDVIDALSAIDPSEAMTILKDLEENAETVKNPTNYTLQAAYRVAGYSASGAGSKGQKRPREWTAEAPSSYADYDPAKKISRQIGWLNKNVSLQEKISYTDVIDALSAIDPSEAMTILKDLEENAETVKNPTNYTLKAAYRVAGYSAAGGGSKGQKRPREWTAEAPSEHAAKRISKQVGWLNNNAGLYEKITYSEVKEALESIDIVTAMKIMKDLENAAHTVYNPTKYVMTAVSRASGTGARKTKPRFNDVDSKLDAPLGDIIADAKISGW